MKKPPAIHVTLDANVLRQDRSFTKPSMLQLAALAKLKLLKTHYLWMIYMECISEYVADIDAELTKATSGLTDLCRKGMHYNDAASINKIVTKINKQKASTKASVETVWNDFIKETGATLHPFDPASTLPVLEGYFSGAPPFSSLKQRKDLPDAYILESLKAVAKDQELHFICNDKNLGKHAAEINGIIVHSTIDDFLNSSAAAPMMEYYDTTGKVELHRMALVTASTEISEKIAYQVEKWSQFDCEIDYPYSNDDHISINAIDDVKVSLNIKNTRFIGEVCYIPFTINGHASIDFFVDLSDAMSAGDDENLPPLSPWNEWVMFAEDLDYVEMTGTLELALSDMKDLDSVEIYPENIDEFVFDAMKAKSERRFSSDL